jgi:hypothetical protein
VIYVTGPGRLSFGIGSETIASLTGGEINCPSLDVFTSQAGGKLRLGPFRNGELHRQAEISQANSGQTSTVLSGSPAGLAAYHQRHPHLPSWRDPGLPASELQNDILAENRYMSVKYQFSEDEPRRRSSSILRIMNTFAEILGDPGSAR